jgi:DNA invertase Pin-like site-specific DNA recombinase
MRVAIYARVSTDDRGQDPENQLRELRDWVTNSGHENSQEYVDYDSGRKGAEKRKQFAALFEDAAKRKFDCVLFWALDRFSREGMAQTIIHLQRLSSYGVAFHSYIEPHLATDNELVRNILLALLSSLAKVEAQKISERTRAGMSRERVRARIPHKSWTHAPRAFGREVLTSRPRNTGRHIQQSHQLRNPSHHSVRRRQRQNHGMSHKKRCLSCGKATQPNRPFQPSLNDDESSRLAQEAEAGGRLVFCRT